ncbi:uncharacterized protein CELE_T09D3.9 [Caenorhabditis elegans]|uniref:Secreted protein n=1 Tax=Caenorhabditis elegans TaxID=6239 RepID=D9N125_CAEEL|nr:Secreted protein [Caenorhabditis elegans]CCD64176.1 Secreted protein [Caenorhabditis elegans]|eukprot:NP_001256060.1 Uncharacterized protein CELE_T09D3.9 [Caenorhabditis elegans]
MIILSLFLAPLMSTAQEIPPNIMSPINLNFSEYGTSISQFAWPKILAKYTVNNVTPIALSFNKGFKSSYMAR